MIFLPSDKGGEFCILSTEQYLQRGIQHLENSDIYKPNSDITPKTIETRINNEWKKIAKHRNIDYVNINKLHL